jgi:hypothetical protein
VNASGAPTRATDADSGAELLCATVRVSEGSTNADTAWACTTNAAITVGTTALVWAQAGGGAAAIDIEDEGSSLTSAPTSINFTGAGVTATASGDDVTVDIPGVAGITGGALTLIDEQTPSGTGTVTFSSIPGTYRDLVIVIRGRSTAAATNVSVIAVFNSDSGAHYFRVRMGTTNGSSATVGVGSGETAAIMGSLTAASATSGFVGNCEAQVLDYRGTAFHKNWFSRYGGELGTSTSAFNANLVSGRWADTSAINQIDVVLSSGNFASGSVVSLYGRS